MARGCRRDETPPSMQSAGRQRRQTIYRDRGLACANYPAYPAARPLWIGCAANAIPLHTQSVKWRQMLVFTY